MTSPISPPTVIDGKLPIKIKPIDYDKIHFIDGKLQKICSNYKHRELHDLEVFLTTDGLTFYEEWKSLPDDERIDLNEMIDYLIQRHG